VVRFWLDRGCDGFRFDVVNFYFHDEQLRSNPPQPAGRGAAAVHRSNPYSFQRHLYDKTQPENLEFLKRLRRLLDSRPGITSIGEIGDDEQYATLARYTSDDRLHMAYTFNLLERDCSARFIHGVIEEFLREAVHGWVCWALNNHDVTRVVTRWQALMGARERVAPLVLALLGSLRGSICLYQGEELGLPEAVVSFEALQDPVGKTMWPVPGRDGCRTPMPWQAQAARGLQRGDTLAAVAIGASASGGRCAGGCCGLGAEPLSELPALAPPQRHLAHGRHDLAAR
jgi:alpha-glucosidase